MTTAAGGTFTSNAGTNGGTGSGGLAPQRRQYYHYALTQHGARTIPLTRGVGNVTLQQATGATTRNISGGAGSTALGLSDTELGNITASLLVIGRATNAGNINIDEPVSAHAGYSTLELITGVPSPTQRARR